MTSFGSQEHRALQSGSRAASVSRQTDSRELLTFRLGAENYALNILDIQEIRSFETPTRLVGTPVHVLGVIDLRGTVVPVIDLRVRFGMKEANFNANTVVIVLSMGASTVGLVVDSVEDVVAVDAAQVKPAPGFAALASANCIAGLAPHTSEQTERMLIVLDAAALVQSCGVQTETLALAA
jgi:purine-binding chemotaxis protein CheW